jgi:hypothetical protein
MIDHLFGNARGRPLKPHEPLRHLATPQRSLAAGTAPLCCVSRLTGVSRRVPRH